MPRKRKLSKYNNITFKDRNWVSRLYIDGENRYIGRFPTEEQAKKAQDKERKEIEHAKRWQNEADH